MEKLAIIGNIGTDATIKEFNGRQFGSFTVGVNSSYKKDDGTKVERTNWYNVLTRETNRVQWLKKGAKVYVEGRLSTSIYRDKEGNNRISLDLAGSFIEIVSFAKTEDETKAPESSANTKDDDLPF
jgi:single-strand DNA-binding protein